MIQDQSSSSTNASNVREEQVNKLERQIKEKETKLEELRRKKMLAESKFSKVQQVACFLSLSLFFHLLALLCVCVCVCGFMFVFSYF